MYLEKIFLMAGGDARFIHLANRLAEGKKIYAVGFENPDGFSDKVRYLPCLSSLKEQPDFLILPMPVSRDGSVLNAPLSREKIPLSQLLDLCHRQTLVLGGKVPDVLTKACSERGLEVIDYLSREELAVKNAVLTAEGALQLAMEELPVAMAGLEVLLTGYGRVSRCCRKIFAGAGCRLTVAARSFKDLAWAEAEGATSIPLSSLEKALPNCQLLINTVPAPVIGRRELELLPPTSLVVDLAPGSVDLTAAEQIGIRALAAPSLPGKVAPVSAAAAIAETLDNIFMERGLFYA